MAFLRASRTVPRLAAGAAILLLLLAGCSGKSGSTSGAKGRLTVFAAASLSRLLPELDATTSYQFGGSNQLEEQIEQGAPADVFVSASPKYLRALRAKGLLLAPPVWFATNRLVLIVPRRNPAGIQAAGDLTRPGVRLVVAAPGVPAGDYARRALAALGLQRALHNVVSEETDVEGVVAKVALGEADAGFVYATDAVAAGHKVRTVPLPPAARERAVYGAGIVKRADDPGDARGYVAFLLSPPAQARLRAAGFGPAPRGKPPKLLPGR